MPQGRVLGGVVETLRGVALAAAIAVAAGTAGCRLETQAAPVAAQASAPDFSLPSHDGRTVALADLLARGPAILVFYRGHW